MEREENTSSANISDTTTNIQSENQLEYSHLMDIDIDESNQDEFISNMSVECMSSGLNQLDPFLTICLDESVAENNLEIPSTQETSHSEQECSNSKQTSFRNQRRKRQIKVPPHIKSLIGEANLRFARGDTETAEKICYEVIRQYPRASEAFLTLAQLLEGKYPDKSLQFYFMAAVTTRKDITLWDHTAERAIERNNPNLAISCYNFALNVDKENSTLHKKRISLLEKLENKNTLIRACVRYFAMLLQKNDKELLELSLKLALLYSETNDYKKAIEVLDISFKKFPDMVTPEMVNIMLDLLINTENYTYCLDIFFQYCNIEIEVLINEENSINIISCAVPDNIPIDFRVKFIICIVKLNAFNLIEDLLRPLLDYPNLDQIADLNLDVAEALMYAKKFEIALKVLMPLIENEKLSLPAVWLKYGECLTGCNMLEEAENAFRKVIRAVPLYTDAKKLLSDVLVKLNRIDDALNLLKQTPDVNPVDVGLLLKRISILKEAKRYDEFFEDVELLLLRHCIKLRHFEELRAVMYSATQTEKLSRLQMMRKFRGSPEDSPITFTLTEEPTVEEEYELLKDALQLCMEHKKYKIMQKLAFTASTSSKFKKIEELQFWTFYASVLCKDICNAYPLIRTILLHQKSNNLVWNFYGCIVQFAEALRHTKFLMHYIEHHAQIRALEANHCVESGSHKLAMMYYLNAIKNNCTSLHLLVLGSVILQICSQKASTNKEKLVSTCVSIIMAYANKRSQEAYEEINYNLGRMCQHLGFSYIAEGYYKKVLEHDNAVAEANPNLSLKREAAYNLQLIYKESGNLVAARHLMMKYLQV